MASNQNKAGSHSGNQGGTHEQHVAAGRQSHKNDAARQSASLSNQQSGNPAAGSQQSGRQSPQAGSQSGSQSGAGVQGGTPEQHAAAGRQSHKNDKKR